MKKPKAKTKAGSQRRKRRETSTTAASDEARASPAPAAGPAPVEVTLEKAASMAGAELLVAILEEMARVKRPYLDLTETDQRFTIARLSDAVRTAVRRAFWLIWSAGYPHAGGTLERVAFTSKGVQGVLSIAGSSDYRHALSDHAGRGVVVVLTSPENYLQAMDEIRARADQEEMFDKPPPAPAEPGDAAAPPKPDTLDEQNAADAAALPGSE